MLYGNNFLLLLIFQPHECKVLIDKIKSCASDAELLDELSQIKCWTYGKVRLGILVTVVESYSFYAFTNHVV